MPVMDGISCQDFLDHLLLFELWRQLIHVSQYHRALFTEIQIWMIHGTLVVVVVAADNYHIRILHRVAAASCTKQPPIQNIILFFQIDVYRQTTEYTDNIKIYVPA